jgi:hypothetical protein
VQVFIKRQQGMETIGQHQFQQFAILGAIPLFLPHCIYFMGVKIRLQALR